VLNTSVHIIPQLGSYVGMPLKNRLFEAQTLTISLSAEGAVTKLGLTRMQRPSRHFRPSAQTSTCAL